MKQKITFSCATTLKVRNPIVHIYCRKDEQYVDVRGIVDDKKELLSEFEDFFLGEPDCFPLKSSELEHFLLDCMADNELSSFIRSANELLDKFPYYAM